jgi:non-specific protein-tyrosine kinase
MELQEMLQVIWKRLWLIVSVTLLISVGAFVVSKNRTPVYQAKVTMIVNQTTDTPFADLASLSTGEELALTYSHLLKTRPLLEIVIANLGLGLAPGGLERRIDTNLIRGTQLLELTVKDTDPQRASDIANEIAFTFISLRNREQQLQSIADLEEEVVTELASVRELIQHNRSMMDRLGASSGLLTDEESNPMQDTLAGLQNTYANLLGTYLTIRRIQTQLLDVTVIEPAVPPTVPIGRSTAYFTIVGAFAGLALGGGLAFLLEYFDRSFETSDAVAQILSLPTLGTVPRLRGQEQDSSLVTLAHPRSAVSEAYRALRTNIRFASVDKPLRILLVTSAEMGAGKTTVASNLSVVCAQAGLQVVLIDADLRLPEAHRPFDLTNQTGLTDLLVGDVRSVEECMVGTGIDHLRLITSGPVPPNPSELLDSKRMEAVLAQVKQDADLVIVDSPPVLAVTDAAALAPKVDGVILVIGAKHTSHEAAGRAREALRSVGATILGVVLTKVRRGGPSYYYYYTPEAQPARSLAQKLPSWIVKPRAARALARKLPSWIARPRER